MTRREKRIAKKLRAINVQFAAARWKNRYAMERLVGPREKWEARLAEAELS